MQLFTRALGLLAIASTAVSASWVSAAPITYDGFDSGPGYLDGTAGNTSGGSGWAQSWDVQDYSPGTPNSSYVYGSGTALTYAGLDSTPGYANGGSNYRGSGRLISTDENSGFAAAGRVSNPYGAKLIDQGTVYLSVLIRKEGGDDTLFGVHGSNISWFSGGALTIKLPYNNNSIILQKDGTGATSATATSTYTPGVADLYVLKFDLEADTVSLIVDPTIGAAEPAAVASIPLPTDYGFRSVTWYAGNGTNSSIDEIRIGTTFADVTPAPIPEPASLGLIGAAGLLLARRRR